LKEDALDKGAFSFLGAIGFNLSAIMAGCADSYFKLALLP
jgi:hypothetical protein